MLDYRAGRIDDFVYNEVKFSLSFSYESGVSLLATVLSPTTGYSGNEVGGWQPPDSLFSGGCRVMVG
jgi:hypothetical protein